MDLKPFRGSKPGKIGQKKGENVIENTIWFVNRAFRRIQALTKAIFKGRPMLLAKTVFWFTLKSVANSSFLKIGKVAIISLQNSASKNFTKKMDINECYWAYHLELWQLQLTPCVIR